VVAAAPLCKYLHNSFEGSSKCPGHSRRSGACRPTRSPGIKICDPARVVDWRIAALPCRQRLLVRQVPILPDGVDQVGEGGFRSMIALRTPTLTRGPSRSIAFLPAAVDPCRRYLSVPIGFPASFPRRAPAIVWKLRVRPKVSAVLEDLSTWAPVFERTHSWSRANRSG
jgi:hypothetical protein